MISRGHREKDIDFYNALEVNTYLKIALNEEELRVYEIAFAMGNIEKDKFYQIKNKLQKEIYNG